MPDSGGDWPAWVQAIGSVAGIAIAIGVPAYQQKRKDRESEAEKSLRTRATAIAIYPKILDLREKVARFRNRVMNITNYKGEIQISGVRYVDCFLDGTIMDDVRSFVSGINLIDVVMANYIARIYVNIVEINNNFRSINNAARLIREVYDPHTQTVTAEGDRYIEARSIDVEMLIDLIDETTIHIQNVIGTRKKHTLADKIGRRPWKQNPRFLWCAGRRADDDSEHKATDPNGPLQD